MLIRHPHLLRVAILGAIAGAVLMMLPRSAAFAAPPMVIYSGDLTAATGLGRRIEMRLKADGTMSMITDYRNNRAPVTEDGRWNPISVEQIDVVIERKDGAATGPDTLHFIKRGDILQATPETAAQFGSQGLQLRQSKAAASPKTALPLGGVASTIGSWRWEGLVSSADRIAIEQPERYTLELQGGGKALVRADCNRGQAAYKSDGRAIAIRVSAMNKVACPSGSWSERYLKSLEAVVAQRVRGDSLFLDLPGEGGTMKFVRVR
ncbi:MAG TPA: META domain-containing protein [Burkholderiales bacterium]|nr:META domain-containing protein [Burkholderiales bacterium]